MRLIVLTMLACNVAVSSPPIASGTIVVTNAVGSVSNAVMAVSNSVSAVRNDVAVSTNNVSMSKTTSKSVVPVFVVCKDVPTDSFDLMDWAESLVGAKQGVYVKNGYLLVVVRGVDDGGLGRIQGHFTACRFLRSHFRNLPERFQVGNRIDVDDDGDENGRTLVVEFNENEILGLCHNNASKTEQKQQNDQRQRNNLKERK